RRKMGAALSIAMDRLFGLLTVVFLAGVSFILRFSWLTRSGTSRHIAYLALILLSASLAFVVLIFWLANFGLLHRLPKAVPLRKAIVESGEALLRYRAHPLAMALIFPITIVAHLAYYTSFYCAGEALRISGNHAASLADILSIMPLVDTIISVPISLGGLGVRETLFQELLGNLAHVPPALAAFTASLGFAIQVAWGLLGAAMFLMSQKSSAAEHPTNRPLKIARASDAIQMRIAYRSVYGVWFLWSQLGEPSGRLRRVSSRDKVMVP